MATSLTRLAALALVLGGCAQILGFSSPSLTETDGGVPGERIVASSGDAQSGPVGLPLAMPFSVTVEDTSGTPHGLANVSVDFIVTGGGGHVSETTLRTDVNGVAQTTLTLGPTVGANTVEARAPGLSGSPVVFTATGLAGPAAQIVLTSGDGQSGPAGERLAQPFVVTVNDAQGNPVLAAHVDFVVTSGGGSLSVTGATTGADGQAQTILTLGDTAGANQVEARAAGLTGSPVVFSATGNVGPATQIVLGAGNEQAGTVGAELGDFVAIVEDAHGNPESGVMVTFTVTSGGGSLSTPGAPSDLAGEARTRLSLATVGKSTVEASAAGLAGSPVVFTAFAIAGFAGKVDFATVGGGNLFLTMGDFNGDGKPDLAVPNANAASVSIFLDTAAAGATTPSFAPRVQFATGGGPLGVAVGDFNGDGKPDLAVADSLTDANSVSILLDTTPAGAATPSFAAKVLFATGATAWFVAVADFNADGRPDLVVTDEASNSFSVLLNTTAMGATTPSFAANVDFSTDERPFGVAVGDLNGDGKPDVAVANFIAQTVNVRLDQTAPGAATPSFGAPLTLQPGMSPYSVAMGDVNGDGKPDLVVTNKGENTVSVFVNTTAVGAATPSFAARADFVAGAAPVAVVLADVDANGKQDLVVASQAANRVFVLLNTSTPGTTTPRFSTGVSFPTDSNPECVAVGDLNSDGKPDLATASSSANAVSVMFAR